MSYKESYSRGQHSNKSHSKTQNVSPTHHEDEHTIQLKQRYPVELEQLSMIFADWSDRDLLESLEEAEGDLELTISRISEGLTQQWGDVTKVKRKEKKVTVATESTVNVDDHRPPRREFSGRGRGGSFAGRGGRGSGRGRGRGGSANGTYGSQRPPRHQNNNNQELNSTEPSADYANAADATDEPVVADDGWGVTADEEPVVPSIPIQPAHAPKKVDVPTPLPQNISKPVINVNPLNAKTSWAQLVKGPEPVPPKPAPPVVEKSRPTSTQQPTRQPSPQRVPQPVQPPVQVPTQRESSPAREKSPQRPASPEKPAPTTRFSESPARPTQITPLPTEAPTQPQLKKSPSRSPSPAKPSQPAQSAPTYQDETSPSRTAQTAPPGLKQAARPVQRTLKQNQPVVMPANTSLSSIGMQFGSLKIGGAEDEEPEAHESVPNSAPAPISTATNGSVAPSVPSPTVTTSVQASSAVAALPQSNLPSTLANTRVPGVSNVMPLTPFVQPNISQYGLQQMAQMGTLPAEYAALYSTEAQARAAAMGYYDPVYSQAALAQGGVKFPGVDAAQQPTTSGQSSPGHPVQSTLPLQQQPGQQQFHSPFYYPYYMPSQFQNPYQSSMYAQPFVNKSVYPGYPNAQTQAGSGQPGTLPKAGVPIIPGSGYYPSGGQQLYHGSMGYDEISGGMGLPQEFAKNTGYGNQQQQFSGFGLNAGGQQATQKPNPTGSSPQTGVDYKNQSGTNRPPRQAYDHKYQQPQGQQQPPMTTAPMNQMYYSQQQQHYGQQQQQQPTSSLYQPHMMQGQGGLYGQNAAAAAAQQAAVAAARQGQPYWANQG